MDKLFTVGYIHRKPSEFIRLIKEHQIDLIVDIRNLNTSQNKPEYSGEALQESLKKIGCTYQHHPEYALPFPILDAYRARVFDNPAIARYLHWRYSAAVDYKTGERLCNLEQLSSELQEYENPCLMAMLPHHLADSKQKMICHRLILASHLTGACREVIHL